MWCRNRIRDCANPAPRYARDRGRRHAACGDAAAAAAVSGLTERLTVIESPLELVPVSTIDAIACNPPLVPDELGFEWLPGITFMEGMLGWLTASNFVGRLFIHLFDYTGIEEATGTQPSLVTLARTYGFWWKRRYHGLRYVSHDSRIRASRCNLARVFPQGIMVADDKPVYLRQLAMEDCQNLTLCVPHSIVEMKKI